MLEQRLDLTKKEFNAEAAEWENPTFKFTTQPDPTRS